MINKQKDRDSNIELLRVLSMFLVMMTHAILAIGYPKMSNASNLEYFSIGLLRAVSIVAVNVFVMISGWFGIRFSIKGLLRFLFQVLFFSIIGYLIAIIANIESFSISGLMTNGLMLGSRNYWFVDCYIFLFVLAPVLNMFCEKADRSQFKNLLVATFCVQTIGAWLFPSFSLEIKAGYSTVSFINIYLLARYVKIYRPKFSRLSSQCDIVAFLALSFLLALIAYFSHGGIIAIVGFFSYVSPFVIAASLFLLLSFTKIKLKSKFINYVASSCFAVYLLHEHVLIGTPLYRSTLKAMYYSDNSYVVGGGDNLLYAYCICNRYNNRQSENGNF